MLQRRPARWRLWRGLKTPLEGSGALTLLTWGVSEGGAGGGVHSWGRGVVCWRCKTMSKRWSVLHFSH